MTDTKKHIPQRIHDAAGEWLVRRQGGASPTVEQAFVAWIAADRRHGIAYQQAERNWRDSAQLASSMVAGNRKLVPAPFLMRHSTHMAAATVGIVAALGIGTAGLLRYGPPVGWIAAAKATTYETPRGEIRTIALTDGSQLTLDTGTRIEVTLSSGERRVSLERGRARFRVMRDGNRPLIVAVPGGTVAASSTVFDVSVIGRTPTIAVLEGHVDWMRREGGKARQTRTLVAGQAAALDDKAAPRPAVAGEARWVSGMLVLDNTPLGQAVEAINRYNHVQLRLADTRLSRLTATGAFQVHNPEAFAHAVAVTFHLGIDRSDPGLLLLRPGPQGASAPR